MLEAIVGNSRKTFFVDGPFSRVSLDGRFSVAKLTVLHEGYAAILNRLVLVRLSSQCRSSLGKVADVAVRKQRKRK